jgi:putative tryptophan/tyrosine transport system substrate-binding protein
MRRREFITLLGGAAAAWLPAIMARGADRVRRIRVLMGYQERDNDAEIFVRIFADGLVTLGWAQGSTAELDYRWGAGDIERTRKFAIELVALQPDVIVTNATPATDAVLRETKTIPVVFISVNDPIGSGFVKSFARPGGNATGFTTIESVTAGKWVEILKEAAPTIARVALLFNPDTAPFREYYRAPFVNAARSRSMDSVVSPVRTDDDIERAIASLAQQPKGGLVVMRDSSMLNHRETIHAAAARYRVPAIYPSRTHMGDGLICYGADIRDLFRRAPDYVDRILRGAKPADLPVQAPTKFELVINLKTAKALGLTIPPTLLIRADKVIE